MRVFHPHRSAFHPQDAIGMIAELEHIAGQTLNGEILVYAADKNVFGFQQNLVIGIVGNGTARGQRRQPRSSASTQHMIDAIMMDERAAPAQPRAEAVAQHVHDLREILAGQGAIRPGAPDHLEQPVLAPLPCCGFRNDLLREHVQRILRNAEPVELAAMDAIDEGRAFHKLIARQRKQPPLGRAGNRMPGAPDTLQEIRDRARRTDLANQIDIADIDAKLERSRRHQRLQRAALQPLLRIQAQLLRQAAVVRGDMFFADAIGKMAGHPFDQAPRIDEDERRAMGLDQLRELIVDLLPHIVRHDRFERRRRQRQSEIARAAVAGVHDSATRRGFTGAHQKIRHIFDGLLGRRQSDPQQPMIAERAQALQRNGKMAAALVRSQRMDFVDDNGPGRRQHGAARFRAQKDVERLRRRDDDMGRPAAHTVALARRRVACPDPGPDLDFRQALRPQDLADAGQRHLQIALDVV